MNRIVLFVFACMIAIAALGAVPGSINYQGFVTDTDGVPLDTLVDMEFNIYTQQASGNLLWTEPHSAVEVNDGLFDVTLGATNPLTHTLFSQSALWMGITVGEDEEMAPRERMIAVPYAFRVATVDGAAGGTITGDVLIEGKGNIGNGNTNVGEYTFVAGSVNDADGDYSVIAGGQGNYTSGPQSVIGGGNQNSLAGDASFIGGGDNNVIDGSRSTIVGGETNSIESGYSFLGGGMGNEANGNNSVIVGGENNETVGIYSSIGGGMSNLANGIYSTVGGGLRNRARGDYAVIAGGGGPATVDTNTASGLCSTVGGGAANQASEQFATVGGGHDNHATSYYAVIAGGTVNQASGAYSTVGGGVTNTASGYLSTVPGGVGNLASGEFSFAAGRKARAIHAGAFVWADSTNSNFSSSADCQFSARASGGVRFATTSTGTVGAKLDNGDTAWEVLSDSTKKTNRHAANTADILNKLSQLPIEEWNYTHQDESNTHIGPMAQDFHALFGYGDDDKSISTIDPDGIALAAIQELAKRNEKLEEEMAVLRAQMQTLLAGENKTLNEGD